MTTNHIVRLFSFPLGLLVIVSAHAAAQSHGHTMDAKSASGAFVKLVRESTERFKDVAVAEHEGYGLQFGCVSGPDYGAMGMHFVNFPLVLDGTLDPTKPEIVIYEPLPNGGLRLIGADYLVLADAWNATHAAAGTGRPAAPLLRGPKPLRPAAVLHVARLGVEGESDRRVRELARERLVRGG